MDPTSSPSGETGDVKIAFAISACQVLVLGFSTGDSACRLELEEFGMFFDSIYSEEDQTEGPLEYGTPVDLCFAGMPMGWSWVLYMAQEIISHQCLVALGEDASQLIRDKEKAPPVKSGSLQLVCMLTMSTCLAVSMAKQVQPCNAFNNVSKDLVSLLKLTMLTELLLSTLLV